MSETIKASSPSTTESTARCVAGDRCPSDRDVQIVGLVEGLDESWGVLQETAGRPARGRLRRLLGQALLFIDSAVKQRPDRPVVVLCTGSPNGFVRRVFEAGADDIVVLPDMQPSIERDRSRARSCSRSRRRSRGATAPCRGTRRAGS